jgi:co-chaperonin GroES (HSP10)
VKVETLKDGGTRREGFHVRPRLDFIFILDYGQSDRSPGGIHIPDNTDEHWRYRQSMWRFGEIIAIGPGRFKEGTEFRIKLPDLKVGDKIYFSRKFGTRLTKYSFQMLSAHYPKSGPLNMRVLDPTKIAGVDNEFEPWWNLEAAQLNPEGTMTG